MFGPNYKTQVSLPLRNTFFPQIQQFHFPLTSLSGKALTTIRACGDREISSRTFKKLPPSEWGHHFLTVPVDLLEMNALAREIDELKIKVKEMLIKPALGIKETKKRIMFVYLLVSLGLAGHFVDEINENLKQGFEAREEMMAGEDDLYTVSTIFWIFRTYGYDMSSDVFKRFQREDGTFKECLVADAKGMLSLYEAAHLETQTEKILDEALRFTPGQLELLAEGGNLPPHISRLIKNSLFIPQRYNNEMIFAKGYISFYEQEEDHDKMLLRFSKLNFRFLQLHWIQELETLTKWSKEQDLVAKLPPYFRDRMVECYFFAFGVQPQFSRDRVLAAKFFMLYTIVDDTCDRFALFPETKILVECMERLVPDSVDSLPDYMKPIFRFTLNVFEESKSMTRSEEEESYFVQGALEEEFKILMRSYIKFGEWEGTNTVPTFDESMEVKDTQIVIFAALLLSFLGLGHKDMELAYNWLKSRPKLVRAIARNTRLLNDMTGFEDDMNRGDEANVVNYYMKQHSVSKEETFRELNKMVRDTKRVVNEEFLKIAKTMPIHILHRALNCGNMSIITYRDGDGFTNPIGRFKDHMTSLFVDLMPL
ncbi:hypothetical protein CARUB_v10021320mg [Capsella rubella]|uniref:Uncharacterized protein n=2 Tax=Capsella rubella TaxID=81985 RepID=R0IB41_9BRAS|nr:hypothetical protein CARUB_v10021320mg [Capsella rubella]